jgi:GTP cyclohydrolase IA
MKGNNSNDMFSFVTNLEARAKLFHSKDRITKAYDELLSGYDLKAEDVLNDVIRVDEFSGIVTMKDISFYTFCEHHFAPFFGKADIHYQPNKIITGIGKLVRLVRDVHSKRLQIQELMTKDIATDIMRVLDAKGVFVETTAKHMCICSRGPSDDNAYTISNYGIGTLEKWYINK